jgi:hypothetical protein
LTPFAKALPSTEITFMRVDMCIDPTVLIKLASQQIEEDPERINEWGSILGLSREECKAILVPTKRNDSP